MPSIINDILIVKLSTNSKIPTKQTPGSAGYDLYSIEEEVLLPGEFKQIRTGLIVDMPDVIEGQIRPRSGLAAKFGITVLNSPGTIDSDYRGEIRVIMMNYGTKEFEIKVGDRIAQIVFSRVEKVRFSEVDEISTSERGTGGFGSTGV